jgi:hypothetical protein
MHGRLAHGVTECVRRHRLLDTASKLGETRDGRLDLLWRTILGNDNPNGGLVVRQGRPRAINQRPVVLLHRVRPVAADQLLERVHAHARLVRRWMISRSSASVVALAAASTSAWSGVRSCAMVRGANPGA